MRLASFVLLLKLLDSGSFEYFFSQLSFLSMLLILTAGIPLYVKDLILNSHIEWKTLSVILGGCLLLTSGVGLSLIAFSSIEYKYFLLVLTALFTMRLLASYFEIAMDVKHKYEWSLSLSLVVEIVFLGAVFAVDSWKFLQNQLLYDLISFVAVGFVVCGLSILVYVVVKNEVLIRLRNRLWKFSAIESGSVAVFGLDLYFASLFFNSTQFAIYALIIRFFSPVCQFQGVVTRHLWSAGYNDKVGGHQIWKQNLLVTQVCGTFLLISGALSNEILQYFGYEFSVIDNLTMFLLVFLIYCLIVLQRHYKNILNSMGTTYSIWKFYFLSSVALLSSIFALLLLSDQEGSGDYYLMARFVFFVAILFFLHMHLRKRDGLV